VVYRCGIVQDIQCSVLYRPFLYDILYSCIGFACLRLFWGELYLLKPIILPTAILLVAGLALFFGLRRWLAVEMSISSAMRIIAIAWLILPILSTMPFVAAGHLDFLSALFETMSGYTTTGLSMYADVESLPKSILFWRSLNQWIGGIGILALFLTVLSRRSPVLKRLYMAEGRSDTVNFDVVRTSRALWAFYAFVTALCGVLLWATGMPLFDSVNHAMTALATGGFSIKNASIGYYDNLWSEIVLMVFLMIGATNFVYMISLIGAVRKRKLKKVGFNVELEGLLTILFTAVIIMVLIGKAGLREAAFQAVSAVSNCGFQTRDLRGWSDFNKVMLSALMVAGGSSGSTAGAVKMFRVEIFFLSIYWYFRKLVLPKDAVVVQRFGKRNTSDEEVIHVTQYITFYVLCLFAGTLVLTSYGNAFVDAFFEVASAIGNTGLTVGITAPGMPVVEKIVLIIEMWIGRVEIFPVLMLFFFRIRK